MLMWVMSDRALPRSLAMMEGFGVHTFRLVNAKGKSRFVKFHWKPLKGVHSLVWDEAQKISGKDPDFHRRDLFEAIERGDYPGMGARPADRRGEGRAQVRLRPARSDQAHPRGARAGAPRRQDDAQPQPRQLLRRDRAGRLPHRPRRAGHRLHQRSAAAGPAVLLHRHAASPRRARTSPSCRSTARSRPSTTTSATAWPHDHQQGPGRLFPQPPGRRLPDALAGRGRAFRSVAVKEATAPRSASAARASPTTSARRRMFWNSMTDWEKDHIAEAFSFELNQVVDEEVRNRVMNEILVNIAPRPGRAVSAQTGITIAPVGTPETPTPSAPTPSGPLLKDAAKLRSPALSMDKAPADSIKGRKVGDPGRRRRRRQGGAGARSRPSPRPEWWPRRSRRTPAAWRPRASR